MKGRCWWDPACHGHCNALCTELGACIRMHFLRTYLLHCNVLSRCRHLSNLQTSSTNPTVFAWRTRAVHNHQPCWWTDGQFPTALSKGIIIILHIPGAQIAEVHPRCFPPRASSTCRQDFGAEHLSQQLQRHFVSWIHLRVQRVEVKLWCQATAPWIHCYRAENWRPMLTALHRCTARSWSPSPCWVHPHWEIAFQAWELSLWGLPFLTLQHTFPSTAPTDSSCITELRGQGEIPLRPTPRRHSHHVGLGGNSKLDLLEKKNLLHLFLYYTGLKYLKIALTGITLKFYDMFIGLWRNVQDVVWQYILKRALCTKLLVFFFFHRFYFSYQHLFKSYILREEGNKITQKERLQIQVVILLQ